MAAWPRCRSRARRATAEVNKCPRPETAARARPGRNFPGPLGSRGSARAWSFVPAARSRGRECHRGGSPRPLCAPQCFWVEGACRARGGGRGRGPQAAFPAASAAAPAAPTRARARAPGFPAPPSPLRGLRVPGGQESLGLPRNQDPRPFGSVRGVLSPGGAGDRSSKGGRASVPARGEAWRWNPHRLTASRQPPALSRSERRRISPGSASAGPPPSLAPMRGCWPGLRSPPWLRALPPVSCLPLSATCPEALTGCLPALPCAQGCCPPPLRGGVFPVSATHLEADAPLLT